MRLARLALLVTSLALIAPAVRAEYVVLRSGLRLNVTGYQLVGEKYRLQLNGGFVEVPAAEVLSIEPEEIFASEAKKAEPTAAGPYGELITAAAAKYSVDADLITSVIAAESNFNPKAISRRNARGLMQLMPQTAAHLGVQNIFDPKENIDGGTHYLRDLLQRYKNDLILALAAYNAGPQRVYTRVPAIGETRNYVVRVKRTYDQRKSDQRKSAPQPALPAADTAAPSPPASLIGMQ
jgi:soluble lytic murein transglycosylase-like protein